MPLYLCSACGRIENTAPGGFWAQELRHIRTHKSRDGFKPLCSEHDPTIGKWHGRFEKTVPPSDGYVQDHRGFLYSIAEAKSLRHLGPFTPLASSQSAGTHWMPLPEPPK